MRHFHLKCTPNLFFGPGTAVELTAFPRPPSWALREREGTGRVGGERREGKRRGGKRVGA